MRRITRYIFREFVTTFVLAAACMTFIIVLLVVAQEAVRVGLGPGPIARLIPYALPVALLYSVPATTLFAVCSIYGRMSAANEFVAIKSLGVTPMAMIWPALLVAFTISGAVVWLNDFAVSWGRVGLQRVVLEVGGADRIRHAQGSSFVQHGRTFHERQVGG